MYKILVVEDDHDFRSTFAALLKDEGYTVQSVASDGEALETVLQDSFDFVFMDMRLHEGGAEDVSGLSLALAFRSINPNARIIILSGYRPKSMTVLSAIKYLGLVYFIEKSPDWYQQVLRIIESQDETKRKDGLGSYLSVSLAVGQSLVTRSRGRHVCSVRTPKILQIDVDRYARRTDIARQNFDNLRFQVSEIGQDLWDDLFIGHPEVKSAYLESRAKGQTLSLSFETSREFLRLPLEFMRSDQPAEYLALQHPLTRFLCDATPKREVLSPQLLATKKRLHVLLIASNTKPPIDGVDAEVQELHHFLTSQGNIPVNVKLISTESATYRRVRTELTKHTYDIIHYAGHGLYRPESPEESSLYFWGEENKQGDILPLKAAELKMLLEHSETRLVYLSCCYGAAAGSQTDLLDDDFLGLLDAVTQAGVPSVLGFRWPVSDQGARELAVAFYRSLLEQGSPGIALWSARRELAAKNRSEPTWLSPILIHQE